MKRNTGRDKTALLAVAREIALELKTRCEGTSLRVWRPKKLEPTHTDGWSVIIGDIGDGQPRIEIRLDRFIGNESRNFYACFFSRNHGELARIAARVSRRLRPHRIFTSKDTNNDVYCTLVGGLDENELNVPVLENYRGTNRFFFGFYSAAEPQDKQRRKQFAARASAFFESVGRTLPQAAPESEEQDSYARENREKVALHLRRERSRLLATECKIRDCYRCQVCSMSFEEVYGRLGEDFAEAHHRVPLGQIEGEQRTRLEDLATVCANCHRMLHRMEGKRGDITRLAAIVRRHGRLRKHSRQRAWR